MSSERVPILLVDDRRENLLALGAMLTDPRYELVTATSGAEALKLLLRRDFALVLLDVMMPEMDGFDVASLMREREKTRRVPIIFLTAVATDISNIYRGYSVGAVDYIQKPLEPVVVQAKVAVFVELYRQSLEIQRQQEELRKQQLAELERKSETRYRDLVESISHAIVWSADAELRLRFMSSRVSSILGLDPDESLNRPGFWTEHVFDGDRERFFSLFSTHRSPGDEFELEHRALGANGKTIWLRTGVRVFRADPEDAADPTDHREIEYRALSVDITRLKEIEDQLRKLARARGEFMSIASHELKTPLTALRLQIQLLGRVRQKGDTVILTELGRITEVIDRQVVKLNRLVDELLDISRLEVGQLQLHPEEVELGELVKEVIEGLKADFTSTRTPVTLRSQEPAGTRILGAWDRLRLEQVVSNLLTNTIKYAAGRPVVVTLGRDRGGAVLEVQDSGDGIAQEDQKRIFERFERAGSDRTVGGLGLGLYITRQLVELQGGSIELESGKGRGAKFTVRLPERHPESVHRQSAETAAS